MNPQEHPSNTAADAGTGLKDAYIGFGIALAWLAIVASVAYFLATR